MPIQNIICRSSSNGVPYPRDTSEGIPLTLLSCIPRDTEVVNVDIGNVQQERPGLDSARSIEGIFGGLLLPLLLWMLILNGSPILQTVDVQRSTRGEFIGMTGAGFVDDQ